MDFTITVFFGRNCYQIYGCVEEKYRFNNSIMCCRVQNTISIQRLLIKVRITTIAHLRTEKLWKTAATFSEETGVKTVRPMEWLL